MTGRTGADALASALIALLILPRTWGLLRDAIDVLLEATPKGVEMADVRRHILDAPGVADVHDLHAWSITSGVNVVSAHVVLDPGAEPAGVLDFLCECLSGDFDIEHSTFQLESSDGGASRRDRTGERVRRNRPRAAAVTAAMTIRGALALLSGPRGRRPAAREPRPTPRRRPSQVRAGPVRRRGSVAS